MRPLYDVKLLLQRRSHDFQGGGGGRPTQEVQHLISSFLAGPRRIWDQKLILYGPLYGGPFSEGRFRGGGGGHPHPPPPLPSDYAAVLG